MIEQMQEQLDGAKGEAKAALQEKLAKLKRDTPGWEEITSAYGSSDAWDDIKNTARLEQLQQAVTDAKASGADKLESLQDKLEKAQAAVPSVDDVKQQASALWQDTHDAVWDSVSGAAMIEQMQEQLDGAKGEAKAALQEKLAKLKQDTPGWEEITSTYGSTDAWDDIKNSAKLEQLQQAVKDAKASGSDKLGGLQEELEKAQAAVPSVDDVKQQASALWQDKADKLPDLDDIRANAHKLREDMQDSVSGMVDNAWGSVKKWF
jgi:chromosome segregation ATPase